MNKVNLFIMGTQKGGTTALADFLARHPDIYVTDGKEAHVFDSPSIDGRQENINSAYQNLLSTYTSEKIICDATPIYMYYEAIPGLIYSYNKAARIIIILRDPSERAFSQYQMEKRRGDEPLTYARALLAESKRLSADSEPYQVGSAHRLFSYRARGHYCRQLENIFSIFPKEQILLLTNNELRHQHHATLNKIMRFLDVKNVDIQPATVFSGDYNQTFFERIVDKLVKLYFLPEKMRLRFRYGIKL